MTKPTKMVASVSFLDNRSISMDVDGVVGISLGTPLMLDDGNWFCELLIRSANGVIALQLLADAPDRFAVAQPSADD